MSGMYVDNQGKGVVSAALREVHAAQENGESRLSLSMDTGAFGHGLGEKGALVSSLLEDAHRVRAAHVERLYSRLQALDSAIDQVGAVDQESSERISGAGGGE